MSALSNADHPEDLYFGIYSQVEPGEHPNLSAISNITEKIVPAVSARGPGLARAEAMNMFSGQDYFLQIDAHSLFVPSWDSKLIALYKRIQDNTKNNKVIISFWGKPYTRDPVTKEIDYRYQDGTWDVDVPHFTELVRYGDAWIGGRVAMPLNYAYAESAVALGGFIFAEGSIVSEVPYDPEIPWTGEEIMFTLRAYTRGWKIYSPYDTLLYHHYERHDNPRPRTDRPQEWQALERAGKKRMYEIITGQIEGIYGLGDRALLLQYRRKHRIDINREATMFLKKMERGLM